MSGVIQRMKKSSMPIRLLMEAKRCTIALETKRGDIYRGRCVDIQESLNVSLSAVTLTKRNGTCLELDEVYLRGSQIRFFVLPDQLRIRFEQELTKVLDAYNAKEIRGGKGR
eukprot:TRINITY_DN17031_c0_g1_i1.p1 TRINITY_DN17031_c0_g1~~TRINITY_DN17031_c0_g1_i1.p1  ORF type:complete len:112 (+),score=8.37 TRINITY_DN17031_c0_g1_i1:128-463(+)